MQTPQFIVYLWSQAVFYGLDLLMLQHAGIYYAILFWFQHDSTPVHRTRSMKKWFPLL